VRATRYVRICKVCGASFDIKILRNGRPSTRKTCSKSCANKPRTRVRYWTQAETEWLIDHVNTMPLSRLVRSFNLWARVTGLPDRTKNAIDKKLRTLGYSNRPTVEFYTFMKLSQMLGLSRDTIAGWKRLKDYPLETYRRDNKKQTFNYVTTKMFKDFARRHPERLGGANEVGLQMLLEDSRWAKEILREYPRRPDRQWKERRVRCIETGKIYPSMGAAGRDVFVVRQCIARAIDKGHRAAGYRFEEI
jgi:hypothetical protein